MCFEKNTFVTIASFSDLNRTPHGSCTQILSLIERVHRKFCKYLLNVKMTTNSYALYSKVGIFPLYMERHVRIAKYFLNLFHIKSGNCILNTLRINRTGKPREQHTNWAKQVRDMLHNIGFSYVWYFPESVNETMFIPILRQRLRDIYITHWHIGLNTCTSMRLYKQIKTTIDRSTYLDILETPKYRKVISQLRLSSHKLTIETGRHNKISLNDRSAHIAR